MRSSRKVTVLLVMLLGIAGLRAGSYGQEQPSPSLREQIEEEMRQTEEQLESIREDLESKRRAAAELAGREQNLLAEIGLINEEIRANRELLVSLDERKRVILRDLDVTNQDLLVAQASYEMSRDMLGKRLTAIYKFGRGQILEILLTSKTFADLAKRIYYLSIVGEHDWELMSVFEERVETRRVLREHIETKKARLEAVEVEVGEETGNLELKREERDALVAQLKEKRYYYENLTRELEEASRQLEDLLAELETRRDEATQYAGAAFEAYRGKLVWPCEGEVVSSFGVETHPQFGTIIRNNGIDIKTMPGTKVRVVAAGKVSYAGALSGFGSCIIVSHGEGFYSLYGHLESMLVSTGYDLREGDAIGVIGETSTPEGAVLHLEIRHGKTPLDPAEWLLK